MTERSLLRERDFRLLAGSIGVSALGDWLAAVARSSRSCPPSPGIRECRRRTATSRPRATPASIPADVFFVKDVLDVGDVGYGTMFSSRATSAPASPTASRTCSSGR
jgi:hypothetical protein